MPKNQTVPYVGSSPTPASTDDHAAPSQREMLPPSPATQTSSGPAPQTSYISASTGGTSNGVHARPSQCTARSPPIDHTSSAELPQSARVGTRPGRPVTGSQVTPSPR